jgi:3-oxoacyl-(acyl-carrier-protein) synthase
VAIVLPFYFQSANMTIYIKGLGTISPQNTLQTDNFLEAPVEYTKNYLSCIEPDYKEFIDANSARRMGRIIKMGVAASMTCLKDAGIQQPDAIITGTGLGCIQDTEKFLTSIIEHEEKMLTPTSFIQSTHNTISAQIALLLKCVNYNFTYVHRGFSFESSLLDGMMMLNEGSANNVLIGAADEMTPNTFTILKRLGHWKRELASNLSLSKSKGSIAGEGASFFVLTNKKEEGCYAKLTGLATIYKPESSGEIESRISQILTEANLQIKDLDLVLFGCNGDIKSDEIYHQLQKNYFQEGAFAKFKHLCGEYFTASSFGLWLGTKIIKSQHVPEVVKINSFPEKPVKNILIYNHYRNINHSLMLLQQC